MSSKDVFRVRGIPFQATLGDLEEALSWEQVTVSASISLSCYDHTTKTAIVQFKPCPPPYLSDVLAGTSKDYQMRMRISNVAFDIIIDKDFYGLTQLYSTPKSTDITADIVAVTGLSGHAFESWRGDGQLGRMWLRDFFSRDFPNFRTMTYGYDPRPLVAETHEARDYTRAFLEELKKARTSIKERARPIIFIGHSFGGIIIAQSLVRSKECDGHEDPVLRSIFEATRAVIFYGIPHRGHLVEDILSIVKPKLDAEKTEIVKSINKNSSRLRPELERFVNLATRLMVVNFYEVNGRQTKGENDFAEYVIPPYQNSTLLNLSSAGIKKQLPVNTDHTQIVKFDSRENEAYWSTKCFLQEFEREGFPIGASPDQISAEQSAASSANRSSAEAIPPTMRPPQGDGAAAYDAIIKMKLGDLKRLCQTYCINSNNVNSRQPGGTTLLHTTVQAGHESKEMMKLLLEKGADMAAKDSYDRTVLDLAVMDGHTDLVKLLLESGAKITRDTKGWTALHVAASRGYTDIVKILLEHHTDITVRTEDGYTTLHVAVDAGDKDMVKLLLEMGVDITAETPGGATTLYQAAVNGRGDIVRLLLEKGADITTRNNRMWTALHGAANKGQANVVRILLEYGADIADNTEDGATALYLATIRGHQDVVKLLLERGTEITAGISRGLTKPLPKVIKDSTGKRAPTRPSITSICSEKGLVHIYFQDSNGGIRESKFDRGWGGSPSKIITSLAKPSSPLAAIQWDNLKRIHLFYLDNSNIIQEYCWQDSVWSLGPLGKSHIEVAPESRLAAIVSGPNIHLFCQRPNDPAIHKYHWSPANTWASGATLPNACTGTSFAVPYWGGKPWLFYQAQDNHLRSLSRDLIGKWTSGSLKFPAPPGTSLAAVNWNSPPATRAFWENDTNELVESIWINSKGWGTPKKLADLTPGTAITAVCWENTHIRLYYQLPGSAVVQEMIHSSDWVNGSAIPTS